MNISSNRSSFLRVLAASAVLSFPLAGCGGTESPTSPSDTVLLSTSVNFVAGVTCATGGVSVDFAGTAGKAIAVTATGAAALTPRFTLYAPDFATQLAGSTSSGAGSAALNFTLTQTGTHHVSLCDLNGVAGAVAVKVTQR